MFPNGFRQFRRFVFACACAVVACEQGAPTPAEPPSSPPSEATPEPRPAAVKQAPPSAPEPAPQKVAPARTGEEIHVPAGRVHLGSLPGEGPRRPSSEADHLQTRVPAFHIDRLPHPNDPAAPPTTGIDRTQAAQLCAEDGKRLCHEIEWERACKGDVERTFPTVSDQWAPKPCGNDGLACATPFGVLRMGTEGREWTASDAGRGLGDRLRTAVVRGAAPDTDPIAHRCAARDAATPDSRSDTLTFRCCRGPVPTLDYPVEAAREPFELKPMRTKDARAWIAELPPVRDLAEDFVPFSGNDYTAALTKGGKSKASMVPWIPAEHPLVWSPVHGEQVWVLTGKTPRGAVVLFAHALSNGEFRFGGSFEIEDEPDPVVVAFNPERPEQLLWSSCWGCGGEGGAIELRDDGRVVIVQR